MGSFQNSFGGYGSFSNDFDGKSTSFSISQTAGYTSDKGQAVGNFINLEEINGIEKLPGPADDPEEIDLYSDEENNNGLDKTPPSMPSEGGHEGGGYGEGDSLFDIEDIDFNDKNGEKPTLPEGFDIEFEKYHYEDESVVYCMDENGTVYMFEKDEFDGNGEWELVDLWNSEGDNYGGGMELLNNLQYILNDMKELGINVTGLEFSYKDDKFIIHTDQGDITYDLEFQIGHFEGNTGDNEIYSLINSIIHQFGGYQGDLYLSMEKYLNDPKILEIIQKYYPDEEITNEMIQILFIQMKKRGCGYIAAANAIFAEFGNLSDEEWFKIFGFEKRNENGELNINYLFLDIFLYYNKFSKDRGFQSLGDMFGELTKKLDLGMDTDYLIETLTAYYGELGINAGITAIDNAGDYQAAVAEAIQKGEHVFFAGAGIKVYYPADLDGDGQLDDYDLVDEGHGYTIVGLTDDGKWIVSTWGKQLIIDPAEFNSDTYFEIFAIDFE